MEAPASEIFVGRGRELEQLERALDAARQGSGTTALVSGEPGIGKTRLASVLAARARDAGFEVLLGRSIDLVGAELPYQPFVEALRPLGGVPAGRRAGGRPAAAGVPGDDGAAVRPRRRHPLLVVLEDLHWADTSTLDLVVFLAHNLQDRRVLLLATYRADELSSAERVRRLAERVRRSGSALLVELIAVARRAAAEAAAVTPNAAGWLALAEAEYERARGVARPERWSDAAAAWALVISVRTAGVHVSHVLRKLGAPNRLEAAAIAHRAEASTSWQADPVAEGR